MHIIAKEIRIRRKMLIEMMMMVRRFCWRSDDEEEEEGDLTKLLVQTEESSTGIIQT